jgi:hypothetical protein
MEIGGKTTEHDDISVQHLRELIAKMPQQNRHLLQYLMEFLAKIAQKSDKNKMNASNLGTMIAPTILYSATEDLDTSFSVDTIAQSK